MQDFFSSFSLMNEQFPWFFPAIFFILGANIGSFLNVVIYRVPKKESVISPRSHCKCGKPIAWYDNLPILSWCFLRGKARCCGAKFSVRYAGVEALTGLLFLASWLLLPSWQQAIAGMIFISFLVPATFIDFDTMELPDFFTVGGMIAGVFLSFLLPSLHVADLSHFWAADGLRSGLAAFIGAFIGSGLILWIAMTAETLLRKEAMGFGDVLFMGCIGAFCGWQGAVFAIFGGAVLGCFFVIPYLLITTIFGKKEQPVPKVPKQNPAEKDDSEQEELPGSAVPFGPWLALGGLLYYLYAWRFVDPYFAEVAELLFTGKIS